MEKYNVAILGATGAVGAEMMKILAERKFPVNKLKLLGGRSAGKNLDFCGESITVEQAGDKSFEGCDIVLGAVSEDLARSFAPAITSSGAVFIDNSNGFRMERDVPLVVPEINPEDAYMHKGIISNPNCSTIIAAVAVNGINRRSRIKSMIASTYQAVSGAGAGGIAELAEQEKVITSGGEIKCGVFPYRIAENLIPQIGSAKENLYTSEEMKMQNEGRKIMHLPELAVTCTCVRVPVMRSHSISIVLYTESKVSVEEAREAIANAPGCVLYDGLSEGRYPMPIITSDQDLVYVGRIREALSGERGLALFCCGDQIRKGAATNAVQIAELLIK